MVAISPAQPFQTLLDESCPAAARWESRSDFPCPQRSTPASETPAKSSLLLLLLHPGLSTHGGL